MPVDVCQCGRRVIVAVSQPGRLCALCRGAVVHKLPVEKRTTATSSTCHHRGARLGKMECGCGSVYRCELLQILCSPKQPIDDWTYAEIDGQKIRLAGDAFRCCSGCSDRGVATPV